MKQEWLIIPSYDEIDKSATLAKEYNAAFEYNDFWSPKVYSDDAEVKRRIEKYKSLKRDRSKDTLHGVFLDIAIASTDPKIKEYSKMRVEQSFSIANELGVRGVVLHTGLIAELDLDYYINGWLKDTEQLIRFLAEKYPDIEIYMENTFEQTPDALLRLAKNLKDVKQFGLCLDFAHAALRRTSLDIWMKEFSPYVKHMHLNDNDLVSDLHQEIGTGRINYTEYKELRKKYDINVPTLLELNGIEKQRRSLEYMTAL